MRQEWERDAAAHWVALEDSATREEERQGGQLQRQLARADPQYHASEDNRYTQAHTLPLEGFITNHIIILTLLM